MQNGHHGSLNLMTHSSRRFRSTALGVALRPYFHFAGNIARFLLKLAFPNGTAKKQISRHGQFAMDYEFIFSDFETWSEGHNSAFDFLIDSASKRSCIFDIGAHIGLTTLPLSKNISRGGVVYAFEPADPNLLYLRKHLQANHVQNVEVVDALLGAEIAEEIPFLQFAKVSGMNSVAISGRSELKGWSTTTKRMITLDSFCHQRNLVPDLIKMDVEGAEYGVLKGARKTITNHKPLIVLSVHPRQLLDLDSSEKQLRALIKDMQYTIFRPDGEPLEDEKLAFAEYILQPPPRI
jgi:FkbM family methyltransferase